MGDEIEIGDVIAEIETDKASMEMEAFDEGILTEILVEAGQKVPVGTALGVLAEEGDDSSSSVSSSPAELSAPAPAPTSGATPETTSAPAVSANTSVITADGNRVKVSPYARKLAAEKGVDVSTIKGTGPGGRITAADVENPSAASAGTPAPAPAKAAAAPVAITPVVAGEDKVIQLSGMRKIIAERLLTSKQTIPHFYLHIELDAGPLMALRKQVNAQAEQTHGNKFTFNDFVVKAMINACAKVPEVNASLMATVLCSCQCWSL